MISSFALLIIAVGKTIIGCTYFLLAVLFAPKFDTSARMSTVKVIRLVLITFFSLTMVTYFHLAYFAITKRLPEDYWNSLPYMVVFIAHVSVAMVVVVLTLRVSNFRSVNDQEYDKFLARSMDREIDAIPSEEVQRQVRELSQEVLKGKDMADRLMRAYK